MKEEKICEVILNYNINTNEIKQLISKIGNLHEQIFDKKFFSIIHYKSVPDKDGNGYAKFTTIVN